ncbi:MAG: RbsD/FucU family protein, partial [Beijerinckiaceae bacterium]
PLDDFTPDPVRRMEVVGAPDTLPPVQQDVQDVLDRSEGTSLRMRGLERFAFYDAARGAFAIVQVGDPRGYGCFLFRKGVIFDL